MFRVVYGVCNVQVVLLVSESGGISGSRCVQQGALFHPFSYWKMNSMGKGGKGVGSVSNEQWGHHQCWSLFLASFAVVGDGRNNVRGL